MQLQRFQHQTSNKTNKKLSKVSNKSTWPVEGGKDIRGQAGELTKNLGIMQVRCGEMVDILTRHYTT